MNMNKLFAGATLLLSTTITAPAFANDSTYIEFEGSKNLTGFNIEFFCL